MTASLKTSASTARDWNGGRERDGEGVERAAVAAERHDLTRPEPEQHEQQQEVDEDREATGMAVRSRLRPSRGGGGGK